MSGPLFTRSDHCDPDAARCIVSGTTQDRQQGVLLWDLRRPSREFFTCFDLKLHGRI
jgi:hypothetical protein